MLRLFSIVVKVIICAGYLAYMTTPLKGEREPFTSGWKFTVHTDEFTDEVSSFEATITYKYNSSGYSMSVYCDCDNKKIKGLGVRITEILTNVTRPDTDLCDIFYRINKGKPVQETWRVIGVSRILVGFYSPNPRDLVNKILSSDKDEEFRVKLPGGKVRKFSLKGSRPHLEKVLKHCVTADE